MSKEIDLFEDSLTPRRKLQFVQDKLDIIWNMLHEVRSDLFCEELNA